MVNMDDFVEKNANWSFWKKLRLKIAFRLGGQTLQDQIALAEANGLAGYIRGAVIEDARDLLIKKSS